MILTNFSAKCFAFFISGVLVAMLITHMASIIKTEGGMPPSDDLTGSVTSGNGIPVIHDTTCDLLESSIIYLSGLKLEGDATEFKVTNGVLDHKLRSNLSFNQKPRKKLSLLLDRQ